MIIEFKVVENLERGYMRIKKIRFTSWISIFRIFSIFFERIKTQDLHGIDP